MRMSNEFEGKKLNESRNVFDAQNLNLEKIANQPEKI